METSNQTTREIRFLGTRITDKQLSTALANIQEGEQISLNLNGKNITTQQLDLIASSTKKHLISELKLNFNSLGSHGVPHILTLIEDAHSLQTLHIAGNDFNKEDLETIFSALSRNTTITQLSIGSNYNRDPKDIGAIMLEQGITNISVNLGLSANDELRRIEAGDLRSRSTSPTSATPLQAKVRTTDI
jgi:hypothetical protein